MKQFVLKFKMINVIPLYSKLGRSTQPIYKPQVKEDNEEKLSFDIIRQEMVKIQAAHS